MFEVVTKQLKMLSFPVLLCIYINLSPMVHSLCKELLHSVKIAIFHHLIKTHF